MTFEEFVASDLRVRNKWVREPGLSIYVRRPTGFTHNADFELASMEADVPGKGSLRTFLDRYDAICSFYIENILNDRLRQFFEKRDYWRVGTDNDDSGIDVCMIKTDCWHLRDNRSAAAFLGG